MPSGRETGFSRKIDSVFSNDKGIVNEDLAYQILVNEVREELKALGVEFIVLYVGGIDSRGRDYKIIFTEPESVKDEYFHFEIKGSLDGVNKHRERGYKARTIIVNPRRRRKTIVHAMKGHILHMKRKFEEESKHNGAS